MIFMLDCAGIISNTFHKSRKQHPTHPQTLYAKHETVGNLRNPYEYAHEEVFMPHNVGSLRDVAEDIRNGVM